MVYRGKIDWVVGWISESELNNNIDINRCRENNELLYCLRSINKYAPFINKIHIILGGNSEIPEWLDANDAKINIVKEPSLYNPVQKNSETKKLFYHLIPGIADLFFTSDDDMFLVNNINLRHYFKNGRIVLNSVGWCCESENNNDKQNDILMLWNDLKKDTNDGIGHIPLLWNKYQYKLAVNELNKTLYLNMGNKRFNPWIDMKKNLLKKKMVINGPIIRPLLWINSANIKYIKENYFTLIYKKLLFLLNGNNFICINYDFNSNQLIYKKQYILTQQFLMFLFPEKCSWENTFPKLKFNIDNNLIQLPIKIGAIENNVFKRVLNYKLPPNMKCLIRPEKQYMNELCSYEYKDNSIIITKKNNNKLPSKQTIIIKFEMIDN